MGYGQHSLLLCTVLFAALLNGVSCARAQDFTVQSRIPVGSSPQSAAITHDGSRLFVADTGDDDISVIATGTGSIVRMIRVGHGPHGLRLSHDGQRLYVLVDCGASGDCFNREGATDDCFSQYVNVVVIDTTTLAVVQRIPVKGRTDAVALTPDDRKLYLARVCHEIDSVDLPYKPSEELRVSQQSRKNPGGYPVGILISPDGRRMFVNYQFFGPENALGYTAHDALVEFDMQTGEIIQAQKSLPNVGDQIALSPDGRQLWSNGDDACSRPDYPHAGCPSVPSRIVNVLKVSDDPKVTLSAMRTFGFSLDEFNGRISISPTGDVFIGGGIYLKRIDPHTLQMVQRIDIAGAGDVVFSPDGQTAYVTVGAKDEVDVLARNEPANAETQAEVAALPVATLTGVLLRQNCISGKPCDVCAGSGSRCIAQQTPTEVQEKVIDSVMVNRGVNLGAGRRRKLREGEDWPCILPAFPDGPLSDANAQLLLTLVYAKDHYNVSDFKGEITKTASNGQQITAPSADFPGLKAFSSNGLGDDAAYLTTIVCHDYVQTAIFYGDGQQIVDTARDAGGQPITLEQVRADVSALRKELSNPCTTLDQIKVTGQDLYKIIFPPRVLKAVQDLSYSLQAMPTPEHLTLAVNLRDRLRYVPVGALWDGNEFLLEKYGIAMETPSSSWSGNLNGNMVALAAGDSNASKYDGLPKLPYVPAEIRGSFSRIPATVLLDNGQSPGDEAFTPQNFEVQLADLLQNNPGRRRIVHLSSHFVLKDKAKDTFLLTESGPLWFTDLANQRHYSFKGVWLVTLSACDTALPVANASPRASHAPGNGGEIQSLAYEVDYKGAQTTIATLWDVADESTSHLMKRLYQNLDGNVGQPMSKGEALRQAQLSLFNDQQTLSYKYQPSGSGEQCKLSYSHPYFWAPFVLIGDWH